MLCANCSVAQTQAQIDSARIAFFANVNAADSLFGEDKYLLAVPFYERASAMLQIYNDTVKTKKQKSNINYRTAYCHTVLGNKEKAFEYMQKSIAADERNSFRFLTEDIFSSMRSSDDWKTIDALLDHKVSNNKIHYMWGAFGGALLILFLYNFLLFFSLRETSYLYYSVVIFLWISLEVTRTIEFGVHLYYSPLGWMYQLQLKSGYIVFAPAILTAFYLLFVRSFLNINSINKKISNALLGLFAFYLLLTLLSFFFSSMPTTLFLMFFTLTYLFCFVIGIYSWVKGYRPARYFVLSNVFFVFGIALSVATIFGVEIFSESQFFPDNIGSFLFFLLLSLALGDKINELKKDKIEAQQKALEVLEEKVQERTAEVVRQKEITEEKQNDILGSIRYAKRIQQSLLPSEKYIARILKNLKK